MDKKTLARIVRDAKEDDQSKIMRWLIEAIEILICSAILLMVVIAGSSILSLFLQ